MSERKITFRFSRTIFSWWSWNGSSVLIDIDMSINALSWKNSGDGRSKLGNDVSIWCIDINYQTDLNQPLVTRVENRLKESDSTWCTEPTSIWNNSRLDPRRENSGVGAVQRAIIWKIVSSPCFISSDINPNPPIFGSESTMQIGNFRFTLSFGKRDLWEDRKI